MGIAERKGRERAEREHRITAAAREIAEREGWSAVTIRRLAQEIEYSHRCSTHSRALLSELGAP